MIAITQLKELKLSKRLLGILLVLGIMFAAEIVEAQYGGARRRTRRRTAVVVSSATRSQDQAAADAAAAESASQNTTEQQATSGSTAPANDGHLPYGTIATKLPEGCDNLVINDVQYYRCGPDYYRVAYQENNLVYVTTEPPM